LGRYQTFSKNVEIIIDVFRKGRLAKVENSMMSDVELSAPCLDISAAPAAANKKLLLLLKIRRLTQVQRSSHSQRTILNLE
jgi:hypothetical protein